MENALTIIPVSKRDIENLSSEIIKNIIDGEVNPLKVAQQLGAAEKMIKAVKDDPIYKRLLLKEADSYNERTFSTYGAQFQVKEVGVKYDYSVCNDPVYNDLQEQFKALQSQIKTREEMLKGIPKEGLDVINEDTGELYKLFPPAKSSTTSVTVTIK